MRKIFLALFTCVFACTFHAQAQQEKSSLIAPSNPNDPADIWFVAYQVDAAGFPTESFSLDNADAYITQVSTWITNNLAQHNSLLSQSSGEGIIVVKRSDYGRIAEKYPDFKPWLNEMARYFHSQDSYQINSQARYVLSAADFNKLRIFVKN